MKAYSYNPITKEYIGEVNCQPNPLEGGYLLPGHAVLDKPPIVEHQQIAIWKGAWEVRDDYRGEIYWDKTSKEEITITEIGIVKANDWTELKPISDRAIWEENKWIEPPLSVEEQEVKDEETFILSIPNLVKSLEARIKVLEER